MCFTDAADCSIPLFHTGVHRVKAGAMNDDLSLAFAALSARAQSFGARDRISLGDYEVSVEIGAFEAERDVIQRLRFNVVVEVATPMADTNDNVDLILSYDTIVDAINGALAAERLNLLETLADRISGQILANALAERVFLRIEKLDRGPFRLGVETVRTRSETAPTEMRDLAVPVQASVVYVSPGATNHADLPDELAATLTAQSPVIVCLGVRAAQQAKGVRGATAKAQIMIDLLSINQNAWAFASENPALAVVETMTELDWGIKNRQAAVWAPSKIIRDAPAPPARPEDGQALAHWLAQKINARRLTMIITDKDAAIGVESPAADFTIEQIVLT